MIITLDLNLVNDNSNNIQEAYNLEKDITKMFYSNLNRIETPNIEDN